MQIDGFGNIITNINEKDMVQNHAEKVNVDLLDHFAKTYAR